VNKRRGVARIDCDVPQNEVQEHHPGQFMKQTARMNVHPIFRNTPRHQMERATQRLDIPEVHMRARPQVALGQVERSGLSVDFSHGVVDAAEPSWSFDGV